MGQPHGTALTPDEFLVWERAQNDRHIYVRGEIFAMAGGSPRHNHLCARIIARLENGIDEGCRIYTSDQRIGLPNDEFVYADALVICGSLTLREGSTDVVTNPSAIVEVLSKSTESYDRGDKQKGYLALASVRHYVLVSQREPRIEVYTRQSDGSFRFEVLEQAAEVRLEQIGATFSVTELYAGVFDLPGD